MNERIQALAEQAREWAYAEHSGYTAQLLFEQKFAELIVRECMTIGFNTVYKVDDDRNAVAVYQNIKQHFGVKE
jgi:hypothetical protein